MAYITRNRGDEFYTQYNDVERMLEQYLHILRAYRVICPFDTHESNFVRYLEDKGIRPEYSDDLDFRQFDYHDAVAVTNPAFSLITPYMRTLMKEGVQGSLTVVPNPSATNMSVLEMIRTRGYALYDEGAPIEFLRPGGNTRRVSTCFLTNFGYNVHAGTIRRRHIDSAPIITDEGIPRYLHASSVPSVWHGVISVPGSWVERYYNPDMHQLEARPAHLHHNGAKLFTSVNVSCI